MIAPEYMISRATTTVKQPAPLEAYRALLASGRLRPDASQQVLAEKLEALFLALSATNSGGRKRGLFSKSPSAVLPKGLYIWGEVGRGKSLLMDLFFDCLVEPKKRRIHFHAFMLEVHARIHHWRKQNQKSRKDTDPVAHIAREIAQETRVLCLDEMQVSDVADATILSRLFSALFSHGVVVIFTSNRPPESLYQGGLQRELFLKFIDLVNATLQVLHLAGSEDYRLSQMKALKQIYFYPLGSDSNQRMEALFRLLSEGQPVENKMLEVQGRQLPVSRCVKDMAWFSFDELCGQARGAADYIALCRIFRTLFLTGVPRMHPEKRNEAKRFVTLVDAMYEHKVKAIIGADATPEALYPAGDGSFEFERTVSRLIEMQSETYLALPHASAETKDI